MRVLSKEWKTSRNQLRWKENNEWKGNECRRLIKDFPEISQFSLVRQISSVWKRSHLMITLGWFFFRFFLFLFSVKAKRPTEHRETLRVKAKDEVHPQAIIWIESREFFPTRLCKSVQRIFSHCFRFVFDACRCYPGRSSSDRWGKEESLISEYLFSKSSCKRTKENASIKSTSWRSSKSRLKEFNDVFIRVQNLQSLGRGKFC